MNPSRLRESVRKTSCVASGRQYIAVAVRLHRRHQPGALHVLDHARGAVVADAQLALHRRDRGAARLQHVGDGLVVQRIGFRARLAEFAAALARFFGRFEHAFDVFGLAQRLQVIDHAVHFVVRHEGAVHALRQPGAGRQVEHVALAQQRLGAHLVEDGARVDLARHLERDAGRDVGLDQAGDDVDRRPLRGQDQVDAGGARLLRQPRDQFLDLLADHHHQVGQFVDHHHDHRHGFQRLGIVRRQAERVRQRRAGLLGVAHLLVVAGQVAHADAPTSACSAAPFRPRTS